MKRVLLVYPVLPRSFWSFQEVLRATGRKALIPPLGLMTVAALLPPDWTPRLVDLNVRALTEEDWDFADVVMISAMLVQRDGLFACAAEAKKRGKPVVAGGPYPTSATEEALAGGCDFIVAGEGEQTVSLLAAALDAGQTGGIIRAPETTDIATAPLPRLDLIDHADYDAMPVQTSRGCPFACEFCDVINLFGRVPRYKPAEQVLAELEAILAAGYRGSIFITDDNFIGNPGRAETLLRALAPWNRAHGEPFWFTTQASINLGERQDLIDLMTAANFGYVFVGIESPDVNVLAGAHKTQNTKHPLLDSIRTINRGGLSVIGSFILGFDRETDGAGERIEAFVEAAAIPLVMINTLQAVPGTKLWDRLAEEGRIVAGDVGDMATGVMNFLPDRPIADILTEQLAAWDHLYAPTQYLKRTLRCILNMRPTRAALGEATPPTAPRQAAAGGNPTDTLLQLRLLGKIIWRFGLASRGRLEFWKALWTVWRRNPSRIKRFLTLLVIGDDVLCFTEVIHQRAEPALAAAKVKTAA